MVTNSDLLKQLADTRKWLSERPSSTSLEQANSQLVTMSDVFMVFLGIFEKLANHIVPPKESK